MALKAATDAGSLKAEQEQARSLAQPVPAELTITPRTTKRVTKAGLLGKQYESGEELAARLTELVQERAASGGAGGAGPTSTASRHPAWCRGAGAGEHRQHGTR